MGPDIEANRQHHWTALPSGLHGPHWSFCRTPCSEYFCKYQDPDLFEFAERWTARPAALSDAAHARLVIVGSIFEHRAQPGHNTACAERTGELAGFYRKMHIRMIPATTRSSTSPRGSRFEPIDTSVSDDWVCSVCWNQWYPELLDDACPVRAADLPDRHCQKTRMKTKTSNCDNWTLAHDSAWSCGGQRHPDVACNRVGLRTRPLRRRSGCRILGPQPDRWPPGRNHRRGRHRGRSHRCRYRPGPRRNRSADSGHSCATDASTPTQTCSNAGAVEWAISVAQNPTSGEFRNMDRRARRPDLRRSWPPILPLPERRDSWISVSYVADLTNLKSWPWIRPLLTALSPLDGRYAGV